MHPREIPRYRPLKRLKAKDIITDCPKTRQWLIAVEKYHVDYPPPYGWRRFLENGYSHSIAAFRLRYAYYLRSLAWKERRAMALSHYGYQCGKCGQQANRLEVHHRHYKTVGNESVADLQVLCQPCHHDTHATKLQRPKVDERKKHANKKMARHWKRQALEDAMAPAQAEKPKPRRRPGGDKTQAVEIPPK